MRKRKQQKRHTDKQTEMFLQQEDISLIYRALRAYQPRENEENLHSVWTEAFEEVLSVDFLHLFYEPDDLNEIP